ncbi:MAG: hypothetical protein HUJ25_00040 [Crocinitomicaceae bacterium]|nr:hypothetical protein [Crocinitomicaceae bacterium]
MSKSEPIPNEWKKKEVVDVLNRIEEISQDTSSNFDYIELRSFGSIEGENLKGDFVSHGRASYTRYYLEKKFPFLANRIKIFSFSHDWDGFKKLADASPDSLEISGIIRSSANLEIREEKIADLLFKNPRIEQLLAPLRRCEIIIHFKK